ncbi:glutathione S-transferase family protein [Pseudooceanicola sp.]|uniref:glutathione S-transferase family protein n=1 Tax=Pseudooceanicola sp. TaxID=1914328 RepID=UPI0040591CDF
MIELYHAPRSRSSSIVQLLDDLGALDRVTIREVTITRSDGSDGPDPSNPHPDGKVPYLVHDGIGMTEVNAIMLYLTDLFPEAGLGAPMGDPLRPRFLSWMAWYGNVLEPVVHFHFMEIDSPGLKRTFRDFATAVERLESQLTKTPWLIGDRFTAADQLIAHMFHFFPQFQPKDGPIPDWVARYAARPATQRQAARDGL